MTRSSRASPSRINPIPFVDTDMTPRRARAQASTFWAALILITIAACGQPPPTASTPNSAVASASPPAETPAPADSPRPGEIATEQTPPSVVALTEGIDVSRHSGAVDWQQVRDAGTTFAFVKATEGIDLADPAFAQHWPAMKTASVIRGAYHFYVTEDDPRAQADFFISKVILEPGDLAPVVDLELIGRNTKPGLADRFRIYLDAIEAHYGVRPIIYTSPTFWDKHMDDQFGDYPLWVAEYGVDSPRTPSGWSTWDLWQWKGDATVPGVTKTADLNRIHPELADPSVLLIPQ